MKKYLKLFMLVLFCSFIFALSACKNNNSSNNNNQSNNSSSNEDSVIYPNSISLSQQFLEIRVDQKVSLVATVYPSNSTYSLTWSSSNSSIVSVDNKGNITGVSQGTAVITVKTNTNLVATCNITVLKKLTDLTGITLSTYEVSLEVGQSENVMLTLGNQGSVDDYYIYSSNNYICEIKNISNWSKDGKLTFELYACSLFGDVGDVTITVQVHGANGKIFTKEIKVRVIGASEKSSVELLTEIPATFDTNVSTFGSYKVYNKGKITDLEIKISDTRYENGTIRIEIIFSGEKVYDNGTNYLMEFLFKLYDEDGAVYDTRTEWISNINQGEKFKNASVIFTNVPEGNYTLKIFGAE